ncbi:MAG: hypothetical protein ACU85V_06465 [Gammaproteobacteria bacterium]
MTSKLRAALLQLGALRADGRVTARIVEPHQVDGADIPDRAAARSVGAAREPG